MAAGGSGVKGAQLALPPINDDRQASISGSQAVTVKKASKAAMQPVLENILFCGRKACREERGGALAGWQACLYDE